MSRPQSPNPFKRHRQEDRDSLAADIRSARQSVRRVKARIRGRQRDGIPVPPRDFDCLAVLGQMIQNYRHRAKLLK